MKATTSAVPVCHVVKGQVVTGTAHEFGSPQARFATPALDLNDLVWTRREPGPAFDTPLAEIIDVLVAAGERLKRDPDGLLAEALEFSVRTSPLPRDVLERSYAALGRAFDRRGLLFQVEQELGGADVLDGWRVIDNAPSGRTHRMRAFPPRLIHVIAGNAPGVAAMSVVRGALTKGVHLIKLPSNDLFTATAILRTMAAVAPGHPLVRSFSAAYWRGGDAQVESLLFRPQFFDKVVAWGGESTIRSAKQYIGPGFELVAFDPKTSISMIGREAFASDAALAEVAERAATDATIMNQQACASSRVQFVEGSLEQSTAIARCCRRGWACSATPARRSAARCRPSCATRSTAYVAWSRTTACGAATRAKGWSSARRSRSTFIPTAAWSTSCRCRAWPRRWAAPTSRRRRSVSTRRSARGSCATRSPRRACSASSSWARRWPSRRVSRTTASCR